MAWSTPRTWTTSEIVTAANMNTYISNNLSFLGGATGATVATSQTTTASSWTDLATVGPAVTVTTMTKALVFLQAALRSSIGGDYAEMGFAVSGASTIAATVNSAIYQNSTTDMSVGGCFFVSGLTAGSNTFTAKYQIAVGGTATFANRNISVIPLTT